MGGGPVLPERDRVREEERRACIGSITSHPRRGSRGPRSEVTEIVVHRVVGGDLEESLDGERRDARTRVEKNL